MISYKERSANAQTIYQQGLDNVQNKPEPKGQKFPNGSRVKIADDLGSSMSHFTSGVEAIVEYTYAHAYGGNDVDSYCLSIVGKGTVSWYREHQLTLVEGNK